MLAVVATTLLLSFASASPLILANVDATQILATTAACVPKCAVGAAACATFSTGCLTGYELQSNGTCTVNCKLNAVAGVAGTVKVTAAAAPYTVYPKLNSAPQAGVYGAFSGGSPLIVSAQQSRAGSLFRTLTVAPAQQIATYPFLGIATYGSAYWTFGNVSYGILTANQPAGNTFPGAVVYAKQLAAKFETAAKLSLPALAKRQTFSNTTTFAPGENAVWKLSGCTGILTPYWTTPGSAAILKLVVLLDPRTNNLVVTPDAAVFATSGVGNDFVPVVLTFVAN